MTPLGPHFRRGVILTGLITLVAYQLARLPGFAHVGVLSIALLVGIGARGLLPILARELPGIDFSAKHLLRIGIVLIGVRLDLDLILQAGPRILILAGSVITVGLLFITWLGKRCGLGGLLPILLAIDSSICGASAVAATAPVIRAKPEEMALVIPLCSLVGTFGMLALTATQSLLQLPATTFGALTGSTLHELAQVMAAAATVPNALESGAVTKLMRVLLLAPAVVILGVVFARKNAGVNPGWSQRLQMTFGSIWFVFGFLLVGGLNSLLFHLFPEQVALIRSIDQSILALATLLMAMAMAGLGLQVDFGRLRENGLRTAGVAVAGWLVLVGLAAAEIYLMKL